MSLAFLFNFPFYDSFCNLIYFHNSFLYRKNKQDVSHLFSTPCILSRKATSFTESSECFCNANHSIWSLSLLFCFDFNRESLWNDQHQKLMDLHHFRTRFHQLPTLALLHQETLLLHFLFFFTFLRWNQIFCYHFDGSRAKLWQNFFSKRLHWKS